MKKIEISKTTRHSMWLAHLGIKKHGAIVGLARLIETIFNIAITMVFAKIITNLADASLLKWIVIDLILEAAQGVFGTYSHVWTHVFCNKMHNAFDRGYIEKLYTAKLASVNTGTMESYISEIVRCKRTIYEKAIMLPAVIAPFIAVMYKMIASGCGLIMLIPTVSLIVSAILGTKCGNIKYTMCSKTYAELRGTKTDLMLNVKTLRFLGKEEFAYKNIESVQNNAILFGSKILRNMGYNVAYMVFIIPTLLGTLLIPSEHRIELGTILLTSISSFMGSMNFILDFVETIATMKENEEHVKCLDDIDAREKRSIKDGLILDDFVCGYTRENGDKMTFHADHIEFEYGSRTVITGVSGTGKSTLANAIVGTVDATDFNPVKTFYVYQESELLDMSLKDNILLGSTEHSEDEILDLCDKLRLSKWLSELENGLSTNVGERGAKVSSGQKQRINIIRAILKMRENDLDTMIILDEPTSNLDDETEKIAVDLINKECHNTLLVITHRPAISEICDKHVIVTPEHEYIYA